ncbi:MAG: hypothetical protein A2402_00755 [Candidatus Staskawiczbacteria bacterium RIFOXYC1_FULL_37_43]|nr:MAG: hypothetical protein A2813_00745 [Candidatus Staskawiczbacteria bacterium RIFCSPHIGHO2_01_FULL_37_17]OGZ71456.1 MAG: hypothetical protein A2891_00910 [Candidatus Staskawiczbacteria bacterium RIFCSPLOWO2_01_FULL_37_19]OGZ76151.1 MAG: hypothetical protein A2205_03825 [Candidatus Staskawiczbacteria bacterium RIFOXYA1_FULL_37_15]OGZ77488.1 MAG: hypothetical protein A2280_03000 [Candidatus Staskawiczbacteria bacterium RIFOXYA12_FULL_37_10]OGZ80119.1 MAG: hypothetical protein A2353_02545 [Can
MRKNFLKANFGQGILWSKDIKNIDLEGDKIYIIHQVLSYGKINQIKYLFKIYKPREIIDVFVNHPKRIYSPAVFNFIKNFILNLKEKDLSANKYVKTSF